MCSPIVDIPVVLVKEDVVLLELLRCHAGQVRISEGGEEEITFEGSPLAALICQKEGSSQLHIFVRVDPSRETDTTT